MNAQRIFISILISLLFAGGIFAQSSPPGSTSSYTLEDLYNRLNSGTAGTRRAFSEPVRAPGTKVMYSIDEIMGKMPISDNINGLKANEVPQGKTFWGLRTDGTWGLQVGTSVQPAHKIGDWYGGGVVFYVDATGEHGLIAAPIDEEVVHPWQEAMNICENKKINGKDDWRLPNKTELNLMFQQKNVITGIEEIWPHWSSTWDWDDAWAQSFDAGEQKLFPKTNSCFVRPIRSF